MDVPPFCTILPTQLKLLKGCSAAVHFIGITLHYILGDPGADSGDEGKSKRAEKCGTKKSKERREEPLGTMSYQTSSKRSPPFWLLIGARKLAFFCHQSEARSPCVSEDEKYTVKDHISDTKRAGTDRAHAPWASHNTPY